MSLLNLTTVQLAMLIGALAPGVVLVVGMWKDRRMRRLKSRSPQTERLLRPPGHSLVIRLEKADDSLLEQIILTCGIGAFAGMAIDLTTKLWINSAPTQWKAGMTLVAVGLAAFGIRRLQANFLLVEEMRRLRLGLRGEQAVAEALHELSAAGCRAFHDVPGQEIRPSDAPWNTDHVLVGPCGVFAIETKTRLRRKGKGSQRPHEVLASGDRLNFAASYDDRAIPQARRNARDLAIWLTKRTGEPVKVDWIVVIPGYYVTADDANAGHVMNAKYLVQHLSERVDQLAGDQVRRIVALLDEKCRDVEF